MPESLNMNIYLGSLIIVVVAAAMVHSPLLELGEIPHPASLVVLADCGAGVPSSSEEHCATKVDSTG